MVIIDAVSRFLFNLDITALTSIGQFLDLATYPLLFIVWLFIVLSKDRRLQVLRERAGVAFISVLLLGAALQFTKPSLNELRPCQYSELGLQKIACPSDGSFPSAHTAIAALFMVFTLGTPYFPISFLFYAIVALSRMYLGVHYLNDVIGGTAFGIAGYLLIWTLMRKREGLVVPGGSRYLVREMAHIGFGISMMVIVSLFFHIVYSWRIVSAAVIAAILIAFVVVMHAKWSRKRLPVIDGLFEVIGVRDVFPGEGAVWFLLGTLLLVTMVPSASHIITSLFIVTIGDVSSAAFSSRKTKEGSLFKNKSIASFAAFVISTLPATLISGWGVFPLIVAAALLESIDLRINDNFLILLLCTLFFL